MPRAFRAFLPVLLLVALAPLPAQSSAAPVALARIESKVAAIRPKLEAVTVGLRVGDAQGSGVLVSADGYVLTAAHVFEQPGEDVEVLFADGRRLAGKTLGREETGDFGMLKIKGDGPFEFAAMGRSADLRSGEPCLAVGHPGGFARRRPPVLRLGRITGTKGPFLRSSAIIDQGDSGGPLFDLEGRVIGIHSRIMEDPYANYHVPIDRWTENWKALAAGEAWGSLGRGFRRGAAMPQFAGQGPYIGVRGESHAKGCLILRAYDGHPAAAAGIQAGDIITTLDGRSVRSIDDLGETISRHRAGDALKAAVLRGETSLELTIVVDVEEEPDDELERRKYDDQVEGINRSARASIVRLRSADRGEGPLAVMVEEAGGLLTKASELPEGAEAVLADGSRRAVKLIGTDRERDLALLEVAGAPLPALKISGAARLTAGRCLVSPGFEGRLLGVSVVAVPERRIRGAAGFLGVLLEDADSAARVLRVEPGTAAEKAGLEPKDLIFLVDDEPVKSREELIDLIRDCGPGRSIRLQFRRGEKELAVEVVLGARAETGGDDEAQPRGRRRGFMRRRTISPRRDDFPLAFQHDLVLWASDCGGPVLDLEGHLVGLNIARASRTETYALSGQELRNALKTLRASPPAGGEADRR